MKKQFMDNEKVINVTYNTIKILIKCIIFSFVLMIIADAAGYNKTIFILIPAIVFCIAYGIGLLMAIIWIVITLIKW